MNLLEVTPVTRGTEPTGLPECLPSRSEPGSLPNVSRMPIMRNRFAGPILLRMVAAMRETDPTDPPECRSAD